MITELEKTKAIVHNQKLLEEALNEKISRISSEFKTRNGILKNLCRNCKALIAEPNERMMVRNFQESKNNSQ